MNGGDKSVKPHTTRRGRQGKGKGKQIPHRHPRKTRLGSGWQAVGGWRRGAKNYRRAQHGFGCAHHKCCPPTRTLRIAA